MSCHNIGRGMNSVVEEVVALYDTGEIALEPAKKIIYKARVGVNYCDGNEYEAVECIEKTRCGHCMKAVEDGENLYDLYDAKSYDYRKSGEGVDRLGGQLAHTCLCASCFDKLAPAVFGEGVSGEEERKHIDEEYGRR